MQTTYDIIIIGGGAAGSAAAIHTSRAHLKTLVLDKGEGLLSKTTRVESYPGMPDRISGPALLEKLHQQAKTFGAEIKKEEVSSVEFREDRKLASTTDQHSYEGRAIIIASGSQPNSWHIENEASFIGRGVHYFVPEVAPLYHHQTVALFGKTENTALDALHLIRYVKKIYWIIPASRLELPQKIQEKLNQQSNIEMIYSSSIKGAGGGEELNSLIILSAGQEKTLDIKAVFLPPQPFQAQTSFLGNTLEKSETGNPLVTNQLATSQPGVFAAGNVLCDSPQNLSVIVAQGTIAALEVEKHLFHHQHNISS